ncbi:hypothetical protein GCM10022240_03200 [Microbacterium kribbense]|uniref:Integral membrane protein n=1 Tax=Microbacterium kribbense TaxID=433645 RepID=A0ABP7G4J8_9MICO
MTGAEPAERPRTPYRRLVHEVAETVALPHTYTLLIWATTMVTIERHGLPDLLAVFCMLFGACAGYIGIGRIAHRRHGASAAVRRRAIAHPYLVACGNITTLAVATLACAATALIPAVHLAWLLVGFVGTAIYLLGIAVQAHVVARFVPTAP